MPNGARDERHPDSQAWPLRGDAEIKGRSAAESERSEEVRSIEGLGRLRRPPLKGPSRAPLSRRRRLNAGAQPRPEAIAERRL
jgi:hypothetical protein